MKKPRSKARLALKITALSLSVVIIASLCAFFAVYFSAKLDKNKIIAKKADVTVFDRDGKVIENDSLYRYLEYDEIGTNVISAFVALEDKRFFKHRGVDFYRTGGAVVKNIKAGRFKEGGSTITQQLAKNTQLSGEKTFVRKIKEMNLARQIEKAYSKEDILEMYLNAIYFGNGIYGIDSAAKNYFGCSCIDLSIEQSALLAGLVQSPARYSPTTNFDRAEKRKNLVLRLMREQNYISEAEYEKAIAAKLNINKDIKTEISSPYYTSAVQEAARVLNKSVTEILQNGYKIKTFYDADKQNILYKAYLSKEFEVKTGEASALYSALLSDNSTGGVSAYFANHKLSVFDTRRQPASALKPILAYAPAFERRLITTVTPVLDERVDIDGYSPRNFGDSYLGWTTVTDALKASSNSVALRLLNETGIEYAKETARRCGIVFDASDANFALALGGMTYGVTLLELSSAYMTLANGGVYRENAFVSEIIDGTGARVYVKQNADARALSEDTAYLITKMLEETAETGTAKKLSVIPYGIASKTGTASKANGENTDCWNASYTTEHTLCVWYGSFDGALNTTGGGMPTVLASYIHRSLPKPKNEHFEAPEGILELDIDLVALKTDKQVYLANARAPKRCVKSALFSIDNCPLERSPYFDFDSLQTEFDIAYAQQKLSVQFLGNHYLTYKVTIQDVVNGAHESLDAEKFGDNFILEKPFDTGRILLINVEAYFENELILSSAPKLLFT